MPKHPHKACSDDETLRFIFQLSARCAHGVCAVLWQGHSQLHHSHSSSYRKQPCLHLSRAAVCMAISAQNICQHNVLH